MFCLSKAALLDSIRGCAASRLLMKANGAWPSWCLLLRLGALLPGFLHWGWARWLKPPSKPCSCSEHWPGHCQGKLAALGPRVRWTTSGGGKGTALPQQYPTLLQKLQPCSGASFPPRAQRLARPAAPNAVGLRSGDVQGSGARRSPFCVPEGRAAPCPGSPLGTGWLLSPVAPWSGMGAMGCRHSQHPNLPVLGLCMLHLSARGCRLTAECQPPFVMC